MLALGSVMWFIGGFCFLIGMLATMSLEEEEGVVLMLIGGAFIAIPMIFC